MPSTFIFVDHSKNFDVRGTGASTNVLRGNALLKRATQALANGSRTSQRDCRAVTIFPNGSLATQSFGVANLTGSGAVGNATVTINGVAINQAMGGVDATTIAGLATSVNASVDPLIQYMVQASTTRARVTCSVTPTVGDFIMVLGQKLTAFSGSTASVGPGFFDVSSGSTSTITVAITNAINTHPVLSQFVRAYNTGGSITTMFLIKPSSTFPPGLTLVNATSNSTAFATVEAFAATASICLYCPNPGIWGNQITFTVSAGSGTFATDSSVVSGRLANGTGMNANPIREVQNV